MTDRTHGPFKVGDIVEVIDAGALPEWRHQVGMVGKVVALLPNFMSRYGVRGYRLDFDEPGTGWSEKSLRLRPPKSDQSQWIREATTTWDKCAWQPSKERA